MIYLMIPIVFLMIYMLKKINVKYAHLQTPMFDKSIEPIWLQTLTISMFIFILAVPIMIIRDLYIRFDLDLTWTGFISFWLMGAYLVGVLNLTHAKKGKRFNSRMDQLQPILDEVTDLANNAENHSIKRKPVDPMDYRNISLHKND